MNTRRRGGLTPSLSEGEGRVKKNVSTNTENFEEQTLELGQAPVFNIHIHLPANNDTNASKLYLPRIHPIIHVHFDEFTKKLRHKVSQQEGGLSEKYLETLIKQIKPKFGKILLHKNNGHSNTNEINNLIPNQDLRGRDPSIELESSRTDTRKKQNSGNSNKSGGKTPNKITLGINSGDKLSNVIYNGHPIKLKKAVVVLKDILKSSSYKSGRVRDLQKEISVSQCSPLIKTEPAPSSPRSSAYESEKLCTLGDCFMSSVSGTNSEFSEEEGSLRRESLASLVEGCYFSEILKKFKEKYRKYAHESSEEFSKPQTSLENSNVEPTANYVEIQKEGFWIDRQSHDVDYKQEEEEDSMDLMNFQNGFISHEIENHSCQNSFERNTETSDWINSIDSSVEESRIGVDQLQGNLGFESSINTSYAAEVELVVDDNEITTRNKLSSDVVEDLGPVKFDSTDPMSDIVFKNECSLVEANSFFLADKEDQCFDLTLVKEEMVSPKEGSDMVNNENTKSREGENGSSPKRIKRSSETVKESTTKAPRTVDYIPLKISGPTEFGVVPLSNVQGYKAHSALNFKKDMLFGKRINRFPNPEHLRMFKVKKQQKYCQNKKP